MDNGRILQGNSGKIDMRRKEGCITAEMEAAAFFAVAHFRKVILAQILYGGDDISSEEWDSRQYHSRKEYGKNYSAWQQKHV